jgi:type II secretory pathway predicted ATPase ExeA
MVSVQFKRGRFRRRRNLESRLARYLASGQGYAVVVGGDQDALTAAISRSTRSMPELRVVSTSARQNRLNALAALLQGARSSVTTVSEIDTALGEIAAARSGEASIVIVIRDADLASPESLERLRIAAEKFSDATVPVRLVLSGSRFLLTLLELPRLAGLATRVTARIQLGQ